MSDPYTDLRPLLLSIAYRMLGSYSEAEDIVQEAYLRLHQATAVEHEKGFLTTVTTRLAIDHLRVRRETYTGPWLPEPVLDEYADLSDDAALSDSLSTAFLVLLERLSPKQRAVFLLRDVFDYPYDEIARIVAKEPAACRQRRRAAGRPAARQGRRAGRGLVARDRRRRGGRGQRRGEPGQADPPELMSQIRAGACPAWCTTHERTNK